MIKNPIIFSGIRLKQTLFSKRVKVASAVHCSLIKHAKIGQSQSVRIVQIISLANEATVVNHKLDFS